MTKVENKTFLMKKVTNMMMSDKEKQAIEDAQFNQDAADFDFDDEDSE